MQSSCSSKSPFKIMVLHFSNNFPVAEVFQTDDSCERRMKPLGQLPVLGATQRFMVSQKLMSYRWFRIQQWNQKHFLYWKDMRHALKNINPKLLHHLVRVFWCILLCPPWSWSAVVLVHLAPWSWLVQQILLCLLNLPKTPGKNTKSSHHDGLDGKNREDHL